MFTLMNCRRKAFTVEEIVAAWNNSSLKTNPEYQRGLAWKTHQQQALIDSIFRHYPLPPLFLHEVAAKGLRGHKSVRYEVVDGLQRIRTLADFLGDKYQLLNPDDKQLRLPNSLRSTPAPWSKRRFSELDAALQDHLTKRKLDVLVMTGVTHEDEIRDLFIRLQSGTALSRQQIRDAWPGNIGPYIERVAGKTDRTPAIDFAKFADKRGERSDDEHDPYMANRQSCAQLLCLFLARQSDPLSTQSIGADDLDKLYHENTEFDPAGESAQKFEAVLKHTTEVCDVALELKVEGPRGRKKKFTKLNLISTFFFMQDLSENLLLKINHQFYEQIALHLCDPQLVNTAASSTSGPKIAEHYRLWREKVDREVGIRLDPKHTFDEDQQWQVFERADGKSSVFDELTDTGDDEYGLFPIAYRDGGSSASPSARPAAC